MEKVRDLFFKVRELSENFEKVFFFKLEIINVKSGSFVIKKVDQQSMKYIIHAKARAVSSIIFG